MVAMRASVRMMAALALTVALALPAATASRNACNHCRVSTSSGCASIRRSMSGSTLA